MGMFGIDGFIINLGEDTPVLKQGRNRQYPISLHSTVPATVAKPPYMPPLFKQGCRHRLTRIDGSINNIVVSEYGVAVTPGREDREEGAFQKGRPGGVNWGLRRIEGQWSMMIGTCHKVTV